jgi:hypothetical protein
MALPKKDRERFLMELARLGVNEHRALLFARYASTLDTLNMALCNGDWPCDNGERKVVPCGGAEAEGCGSYYVPSALKGRGKRCPDCRTSAKVSALAQECGLVVQFSGDPRGVPFRLTREGGAS